MYVCVWGGGGGGGGGAGGGCGRGIESNCAINQMHLSLARRIANYRFSRYRIKQQKLIVKKRNWLVESSNN